MGKNKRRGQKGQMSIFFLAFVAFFWALWPCRTATELTVNVSRNKTNPEIGKIRQSITGNSSTETVTIEFKEVDPSLYVCPVTMGITMFSVGVSTWLIFRRIQQM